MLPSQSNLIDTESNMKYFILTMIPAIIGMSLVHAQQLNNSNITTFEEASVVSKYKVPNSDPARYEAVISLKDGAKWTKARLCEDSSINDSIQSGQRVHVIRTRGEYQYQVACEQVKKG